MWPEGDDGIETAGDREDSILTGLCGDTLRKDRACSGGPKISKHPHVQDACPIATECQSVSYGESTGWQPMNNDGLLMRRENKWETIEIAGDQRLWKLGKQQHAVGEGIMCLEQAMNQRVTTHRQRLFRLLGAQRYFSIHPCVILNH